jgi:hypothetical protein
MPLSIRFDMSNIMLVPCRYLLPTSVVKRR